MDVSIDYQALFPNCYLKIMFPGSVALNLHACMCFCFQHMTNKHSHVYLEMFICTPAFERETLFLCPHWKPINMWKIRTKKTKLWQLHFFALLKLFSQTLENKIYIPHVMKQIVMTLADLVAMLWIIYFSFAIYCEYRRFRTDAILLLSIFIQDN